LIEFSGGMLLFIAFNDILPHTMKIHNHHDHSKNDHHKLDPGIFTGAMTFICLLFLRKIFAYSKYESSGNLDLNESDCCSGGLENNKSKVQIVVFIVNLSIHSFLEGIGSMNISRMFAMLIHKGVESFTIGISLAFSNFSKSLILLLVIFNSIMTPLGIITQMFPKFEKLSWFLNGNALGSILYIIFVEIFPSMLKDLSFLSIFVFLAGYLTTIVINFFI
ncbi:hypothetical protein H311_01923, partial [Anncaliia algerae PRA109]